MLLHCPLFSLTAMALTLRNRQYTPLFHDGLGRSVMDVLFSRKQARQFESGIFAGERSRMSISYSYQDKLSHLPPAESFSLRCCSLARSHCFNMIMFHGPRLHNLMDLSPGTWIVISRYSCVADVIQFSPSIVVCIRNQGQWFKLKHADNSS
jgi:hypothetical protein